MHRLAGAIVACVLLLAVFCRLSQAQGSEYQLKAARIARIAQVTSWPQSKLAPNSPLVIGVYGHDTIADFLEMAVQGRRLKGREVTVKRCTAVQEVSGCHVLFVSHSEQDRLRDVLRRTNGEPILTIGESENFMDKGGIVQLTMIGGSAQFTLDFSNLKRARLEIDPETLALANPAPRR
jgi:hypothetical protein